MGSETHRAGELGIADAKELLDGAASDDCLPAVLELGRWLHEQEEKRFERLDQKAIYIVGFSVGILAFVSTQAPTALSAVALAHHWVLLVSALCAVLSSALGLMALMPMKGAVFTDSDWLRQEVMNDRSALDRYYALTFLKVIQANRKGNSAKSALLIASEVTVAVSAALIAVAFVLRLSGR